MRPIPSLLVMLALTGCVAIPYPAMNNIDREGFKEFESGATGKRQVVEALGDPLIEFDDGKTLLFDGTYSKFGLLIAVGGGYSGAVSAGDIPNERYLVLVRFNGKNRIKSWRAIKTESANDWSPPSAPRPPLVTIRKPGSSFSEIEYSRTAGTIVALGSDRIYIWPDAPDSDFLTLSIPSALPGPMALSGDGSTLAVPMWYQGTFLPSKIDIAIYNMSTRSQTGHVEYDHWWSESTPRTLALSQDGSLLASTRIESFWHGSVPQIWDARKSPPRKQSLVSTPCCASSVSFSPIGDDLAVTGNLERSFLLRGNQRSIEYVGQSKKSSSEMYCRSIAYSHDANYLAIVCTKHIQVWERRPAVTELGHPDAWKLKSVLLVPGKGHGRTEVSFSHDARQIIALATNVTVWDLESEEEIWRITSSDLRPLKARGLWGTPRPPRISNFIIDSVGLLNLATENGIYIFDTNKLESQPITERKKSRE